MEDWRDRPTLIEEWEESIDSILSIDENGTIDLNGIRKNIINVYGNRTHNDRWFTITGVEMNRDDFEKFRDSINTIKYGYWDNGCFQYKRGNRRVVFHSREIRKRQGPFNPRIIDYGQFMIDITEMIKNTPFEVFSSSIDKAYHLLKYANPYPVYNLCLEFILERYCRQLRKIGKSGAILLESRGKREDRAILEYLKSLLDNGNKYWSRDDFSSIKGVYFNPKWSSKHDKKMSFILLELADLVSYPIHKYVKLEKKDPAFQSFEEKISNFPFINGYGLKIFP